jgi:PAS domain S-box-containing protein
MAMSVESLGYGVSAVVSSFEACLHSVEDNPPDIVLMDIGIDGESDGIDAAARLRETRGIPVVYVTGHTDDEILRRAKQTTPLGYLVKPFRRADLKAALEVGLFRHQAEQKLREKERKYDSALQAIDEGVVLVGASGRIEFLNPAAEALLCTTLPQATGHRPDDVFRLRNGETRALLVNPLETVLQRAEPVRTDMATTVVSRRGAVRVVASAAPIRDHLGHVVGGVLVLRDAADGRESLVATARAARMAELGTLAAGLAHEVNNPLTYMMGQAEMARETLKTAKRRLNSGGPDSDAHVLGAVEAALMALGEIEDGSHRIGAIVGELSGFSSSQPGDGVDVNAALAWALRVTESITRGRTQVVVRLDKVQPVHGTDTKIGQLFVNLIINAVHAMSDSDPSRNELYVSSEDRGDDGVLVTVRDNGCGMDDTTRQRIFDPFFTTKPAGVGTGIGLFICRRIVDGVEGHIEVESQPGTGTTFRIVLPTV